jgi:hypothetical protein
MSNNEPFLNKKTRKAHFRSTLPPVAQRELERCCEEGLTARQTRLRLARCGVVLADRTITRRMATWRAEHAATETRTRELREIGVGIGSVHANLGAIAQVVRTTAPGWRDHHAAILREQFAQFLREPTPEGFTAITVGTYTLLISISLADCLAVTDGN